MRAYPVTFEEVTISAQQDLFELYWPSSTYKALRILRQWFSCSDVTLPSGTFLPIRSRILFPTVTNGSGGNTPNIGKADTGDANNSFAAYCNNTTKATTTGSYSIQYEDGFYLYQGHEFMYDRPPVLVGGSGNVFVFELLNIPSGFSVKMSGGLLVEEMG